MGRLIRIVGVGFVVAAVVASVASSRIMHPPLTVSVTGPGSVSSDDPPNVDCPGCFNTVITNCRGQCTGLFQAGLTVTLTATPDPGAYIVGWSGSCGGTSSTCRIVMPSDTGSAEAGVTFAQVPTYGLSVSRNGSGGGTVTSSPAGISCGSMCSASFSSGTTVALAATPDGQSDFSGWGGACSGTGACVVTLSAAASVTATFTAKTVLYTVSVTKSGAGSGHVTSSPGGLDCGSACSASFAGTVQLTAIPDSGSSFTGWSGACSGSGTCTLNVNANESVSASFALAPNTYPVVVTKTGVAGSGSVTSSPAGINCGSTCVASMSGPVQLTATPDTGSTFMGWTGACSGTNLTCALSVTAARSVTAEFEQTTGTGTGVPGGSGGGPFPLVVGRGGSGTGAVKSTPAGIDCGAMCKASVRGQVQLIAAPDPGSRFAGWQGACAGAQPTCTLIADGPKSVTANFDRNAFRLTVRSSGSGRGIVTSQPAGIDCSGTCAALLAGSVRLVAKSASGSAFTGWSGACLGIGACILTMDAAKNVVARFADITAPVVSVSGTSVRRGAAAVLRFAVTDAGGAAAERLVVVRGVQTVIAFRRRLTTLRPLSSIIWHVPKKLAPGTLRFCVVATDRAGNASASRCAALTVRP